MRDSSAATTQIVTVLDSGDDSGLMLLRYGASVAEHNLPWAWGASDGIYLNLRFEID
jgi:hypothetical protein